MRILSERQKLKELPAIELSKKINDNFLVFLCPVFLVKVLLIEQIKVRKNEEQIKNFHQLQICLSHDAPQKSFHPTLALKQSAKFADKTIFNILKIFLEFCFGISTLQCHIHFNFVLILWFWITTVFTSP